MNHQDFLVQCIHAYIRKNDNIEEILYNNQVLEKIYVLMEIVANSVTVKDIKIKEEGNVDLYIYEKISIQEDTSFYNIDLSIMSEILENESIIHIERR